MEISTHILLNYLLETSICLSVFYTFYALVLRRQPTFAYNRAYLLISSLLGLVFPLLQVPLLGTSSAEFSGVSPSFSMLMLPEMAVGETNTSVQTVSWQQVLLWGYMAGALWMLVRFCWQIYGIRQVIRKEYLTISRNSYWVVHTNGKLPISSFFNYLLWDNQAVLSEADKQRIIEHEEVHIAEGHSYDVMYMSLIKILLWFNPFTYLYCKELTDVHEYAADAKVINKADPKDYARILVNQLFHRVEFSLLNHFYKSQTLKRLKMMELTKSKINRYRMLWALPVFALMFFVFSCQEEADEMSKLTTQSEAYANATEEEKKYLPDADGVFTVVEEQPAPEGGMKAFYEHISRNLKFPSEARQRGIGGRAFVQFVVDTDGSITEVETVKVKGEGVGFDKEGERVVRNAPVWNPGRQDGKAVKVKMILPITFLLDDGREKLIMPKKEEAYAPKLGEVVVVAYKSLE